MAPGQGSDKAFHPKEQALYGDGSGCILRWLFTQAPVRVTQVPFSDLHCENLVGLPWVRFMNMWGLGPTVRLEPPGIFNSNTSAYPVLSNLSRLPLKCYFFRSFCSREADIGWHNLHAPIPPNVRVMVCPVTLGLWWEIRIFFQFVQLFLVVRMEVTTTKISNCQSWNWKFQHPLFILSWC